MMNTKEAQRAVVDAKIALQIAKDNLAFAGMTKKEKRVAVAKDVIAWINLGKLNPRQMTYLAGNPVKDEKCDACALGAAFACLTVKTKDLGAFEEAETFGNKDDYMRSKLRTVFTAQQIANIESAFEGNKFHCAVGYEVDEDDELKYRGGEYVGTRKAESFNDGIYDPAERMIRIMKNIIRNGGEFRP